MNKLESWIGKFIWKGRILRVALEEMKNDLLSGGFKLPCVATMCRSLLLSHCLRLLRSEDDKSIKHIDYWMGALLEDIDPKLGKTVQADKTPEYFTTIGGYFADIMVSGFLTTDSLPRITNKLIYRESSDFPTVKVVLDNPNVNYGTVWRRLQFWDCYSEEYERLFLLIHNKLSVPERLCRIGVWQDPYCQLCPGQNVSDILHFFTSCSRTREVWKWMKLKLSRLCDVNLSTDWDFLNLNFTRTGKENTVVWLLGTYVNYVWTCYEETLVDFDRFFGYLTFKYRQETSLHEKLL